MLHVHGARGSWKIAGSRLDEVNEVFQFTYSFRPHWGLGFTQPLTEISNRSRQMIQGGKARPVRRGDNLAAICELIV
jgi:hypothetical protein